MYNTILKKLQIKLKDQSIKIEKFEALEEDGNVFVGYHDMDAEFVIGKLMVIENNPGVIWKALEHCYGNGYFKEAIEKMYGISGDYKDLLLKDF